MNLSKKEVVWGYFAQFFTIASGILILPLVLRLLTPEEIGMNFLMLTIGTMVSLLDFGFAPQIGRNFSYVFAGAQILQKEGLGISNEVNATVNYRLLATLIHTAKFIYRIISFVVLFVIYSNNKEIGDNLLSTINEFMGITNRCKQYNNKYKICTVKRHKYVINPLDTIVSKPLRIGNYWETFLHKYFKQYSNKELRSKIITQ